eukprot:866075-Amphidinium_carterae.1
MSLISLGAEVSKRSHAKEQTYEKNNDSRNEKHFVVNIVEGDVRGPSRSLLIPLGAKARWTTSTKNSKSLRIVYSPHQDYYIAVAKYFRINLYKDYGVKFNFRETKTDNQYHTEQKKNKSFKSI